MINSTNQFHVPLLRKVTCPHCWHGYAPEDSLWIATHPDLQHDPRVGESGLRFLPTRFNVKGNALDSRGMECLNLACPNCHLEIPRPVIELESTYVSIAGTPSCGKTYFLTSMTWCLRRTLPTRFATSFADADPAWNLVLNEYENHQFFNDDADQLVKLAKTEEHGHLYDTIQFDDQVVSYPRPFLFTLRPGEAHPNHGNGQDVSRLVCLYDNAGESFEPGKDQVASPVTRHLATADVLMFCFDPTQDPRVREKCKLTTKDPQVIAGVETRRQESILHEMLHRIRRHSGLHANERTKRPLIIIVNKYDVWWSLHGEERLREPWIKRNSRRLHELDMAFIQKVSSRVRDILRDLAPEIVSAAESISSRVLYVPVSATGCSPEPHPDILDENEKPLLCFRPRNINPMWAEVPLLAGIVQWKNQLIPYSLRDR